MGERQVSDFSGANPDELDALARTMDECAARLHETGAALDRAAAQMTWSGSDAAGFRARWAGHGRRLLQTADEMADRAAFIRGQADDQRRASASTPPSVAGRVPSGWALRDPAPATPPDGAAVTGPRLDDARLSISLGGPPDGGPPDLIHASTSVRIGEAHGVPRPAPMPPHDLVTFLRDRLATSGRPSWLQSR